MRQLGNVFRLKSPEEDLLEVLDLDGTVAFMELKERFITWLFV